MVGCELVLAHVMGKPESLGTATAASASLPASRLAKAKRSNATGNKLMAPVLRADVDGAGMKRENRAVIPKVDSRTADPQQMYRIL